MSQNIEELESQAMDLSLDAPSEEENLVLWVTEAERRIRELREGRAKEIPAEETFQRARAAIS